jgi:EAL domain-containing protein (putative c-di-GMP-specific phosphodiesterase class I)
VASIDSILEKYNIPKKRIVIELTEQDVAMATDRFKEQIKKIKDNGYVLWLDDFGSGYSSLNIFSQYDFDLVKFDLELLHNLDRNNGANRLILKAMVDIAKQLGIQTLAEGMETEEQLKFLQEIGCEMAQGFLFYTPESFESIDFKLKSGNPMIGCDIVDD